MIGRRTLLTMSIAALVVLSASAAWSFSADEPLDDPALEARSVKLHHELRCLVCQGQSIADSNAGLARDLRILVRERIAAGESDEAIVAFLTERYGDFVMLRPPVKSTTYALWFGPPAVLVLGGLSVFFFFRRRRARAAATEGAPSPLSDSEQHRLDELLDDKS